MESQLEGFEFARQREPVTDGIDVWGTVFELEHAHHGNIAVVILGTGEIFFSATITQPRVGRVFPMVISSEFRIR